MRLVFSLFLCFLLFQPALRAREPEVYLASKGLVNVLASDSSIRVCLKYATTDNFLGEKVYDEIEGIWLHPDAANKLLKAQQLLKEEYPDYTILVLDAARPMPVQRKMWDKVKGTDKNIYVSNPAKGGGLHNYGMAVDVTISDAKGNALAMGTPFDFFGEEAHITNEKSLVEEQRITREEWGNRLLLRKVMRQAGFSTIQYEWWHFNACSREEAKKQYILLD